MAIYTSMLCCEGMLAMTAAQIITATCGLFNYDFSYFSKDYLGLFLAVLWFFVQSLQARGQNGNTLKFFNKNRNERQSL